MMEKEYITRLIYEYNPELTGKNQVIPDYKRELFFEILKFMDKKQIIAITGLRRIGKTILMKQLIKKIKNAFFFSFDEEETQNKETLAYVIDFFLNNLKATHIFLDEIQYVRDWQGILKRYYDTKNLKFIISGSESLDVMKAKESLAGRIITFKLETLTFKEFLELKGKKLTNLDYEQLLPEKEFFEFEFLNYLFKGAFPELVDEDNEIFINKYIRDLVVKKIIYNDLPRIFEIKRKDLLFSLFRYICTNSSNLFEIKNLCKIFNADYETITTYIFYLEQAFLIKISEVYSGSISKRIRRNKKIYVIHPAIAISTLAYRKEMLIETLLGQYVESLFGKEFFWRDKHKNEVDLVIKNKPLLPIEIKYKNNISAKDTKGLIRFMDVFNLKRGIVITKDIRKKEGMQGKNIEFIPAWYFSLTNY